MNIVSHLINCNTRKLGKWKQNIRRWLLDYVKIKAEDYNCKTFVLLLEYPLFEVMFGVGLWLEVMS